VAIQYDSSTQGKSVPEKNRYDWLQPGYSLPQFVKQYGTGVAAPSSTDVANQLAQTYNPFSFLNAASPDFAAQAQQQAGQIYGPQYAMLQNQETRAKSNSAVSDKKLAALYKSLMADTQASGAASQSTYADAAKSTADAGSAAKKDTTSAYASALQDAAGAAKLLGLNSALGGATAQTKSDQANASSQIDNTNQLFKSALAANSAASADLAANMTSSAAMQGAEARGALQSALQDRLAAIADQRQTIASQEASTVANLTGQLSSTYQQQQQAMAELMAKQQQQQFDNNLALQKFELQKQTATGANAPSQYQQWEMQSPIQRAMGSAANLLGTDGTKASDAINLIMSVGSKSTSGDAFQFAKNVLDANKASGLNLPEDQLQALAVQLYSALKPTSTGAIMNYLNQQ
jgi:hypothetical protein